MPRKVDVIASVTIDGYTAEIGLVKKHLDIANMSPVAHPLIEEEIYGYRKMICMQARRALLKKGRSDTWVSFEKLQVSLVRNV